MLYIMMAPIFIGLFFLLITIYYYVKFLRQRKIYLKEMNEREERYIKASKPIPPRGYVICEPFGKY